MKKIFSLAVVLILLMNLLYVFSYASEKVYAGQDFNYVLGDINKDNTISAMDALMTLQLSSGRLTTNEYTSYAGDANKDGKISSIDALRILQLSSGKLKSLGGSVYTQKWVATELSFNSSTNFLGISLLTDARSDFEAVSVPTGWDVFGGGNLSISTTVAHNGASSLCMTGRSDTWISPSINVYDTVKANGAGIYSISFWVFADTLSTNPSSGRIVIRGDAADANSFIVYNQGPYYAVLTNGIPTAANTWIQYSASFTVLDSDITRSSGNFSVMLDSLAAGAGQKLYLDDFQITKASSLSAFDDVTMDVSFSGPNNTSLSMPAFWDGGNTWKVRFAPTQTGTWTYHTICNLTTDTGLNNQSGTVSCTSYKGNLDIYKHGFIKTEPNTRYFTYDDGTPFFYLGDTHWGMPMEPYDGMFKTIVDDRASKGFTAYQSEPLGEAFDLEDGTFGKSDLAGFQDLDNRFKYIADHGLVHANSQFFFVSSLINNSNCSYAYLDKLSRYWVARYGAYPVLWTTAQECDSAVNEAYYEATDYWRSVIQAVNSYDPYKHPSTAHQNNTGVVRASGSLFKDLSVHKWFAAQWSPTKNGQLDFNVPKDYWNNSGGKPSINYEGHYENLATNEFGARMQGWTAYLNGMYGHGYGAQDIWLYNTDYYEDVTWTIDGITITPEMKHVTWETSIFFNTPLELGTYMKGFFSEINWWQLTPRFDDTAWFVSNSSYYSVASIDNNTYVAYFYNPTTNTGTLKNMDNAPYAAKWYNPRSGASIDMGMVFAYNGQWSIPPKPDTNDWVLLVNHLM